LLLLSLTSERWSRLEHAYGRAHDIPGLLHQLKELPPSGGESEPWFTLWSSLAHQGDVYSASFAAVPHVVAALASSPLGASQDYVQFPAWVEICRSKKGSEIPEDLREAYFESLASLPSLVAAAAVRPWDQGFLACALAAVAAAKGHPVVAEAVLTMSSGGPDVWCAQ
jgi:hypothetical protein